MLLGLFEAHPVATVYLTGLCVAACIYTSTWIACWWRGCDTDLADLSMYAILFLTSWLGVAFGIYYTLVIYLPEHGHRVVIPGRKPKKPTPP